jgi:hypothetical protein
MEVDTMKFKVGDIIRGTSPDRYLVTNSDMFEGEVIDVLNNSEKIRIKVLKHKNQYEEDCIYRADNDDRYFELTNMHIIDGR